MTTLEITKRSLVVNIPFEYGVGLVSVTLQLSCYKKFIVAILKLVSLNCMKGVSWGIFKGRKGMQLTSTLRLGSPCFCTILQLGVVRSEFGIIMFESLDLFQCSL